jgi:hypothetical protein
VQHCLVGSEMCIRDRTMTPQENDNQSTIEVLNDEGETVFTNV